MSTSQKVAIVTGASQGIGAETVKAFRQLGYRVVATARSIKPSEDPNLVAVAGDIANAQAHPGPYPAFSDVAPVPKDVRPAKAWRAAVYEVWGKKKQTEAEMLEFADVPPQEGSRLSCQIKAAPELDGLVLRVPAA